MDSWNFCKRTAFTLAEVLITLGIIGVVAAITIPALQAKVRNTILRTQLKKSYAEWNQIAMSFMEGSDMSIPDYVATNGKDAMQEELKKYVVGYGKISDYTVKKGDDGKSELEYEIHSLNGYKVTSLLCDTSGYSQMINGRIVSFDDTNVFGYNGPRLCIDINGKSKPNVLGLDIHYFIFTVDGHVIPEGAEHEANNYEASIYSGGTKKADTKYCNGSSDSGSLACTYYAIMDISPDGKGTYWNNFIKKKVY